MATNGKCLFVTQALADRVEDGVPVFEIEYDDDVICTVDLGTDWEIINYFFETYSDEADCGSYLHEALLGGRPLDSGDDGSVYYIPSEDLAEIADEIGEITEQDFLDYMDLDEMQAKGIAMSVDESEFDAYCESAWDSFQDLQAAFEDAAGQDACSLFCVS